MMIFFFFLFFLGLLLESTVTTFPIVLVVLLLTAVFQKNSFVFELAFFAGVVLDIISLRSLGQTSIFFVIFLGLIFLYQRKFEVQSVQFVAGAALLGSVAFLLFFKLSNILLQTIIVVALTVFLFEVLEKLFVKEKKRQKFAAA